MLVALRDNVRVRPSETGQRATCPQCCEDVLSKCGQINIAHWAHLANSECDSWSEPESEWHLNWKQQVPVEWIEATIDKNEKRHRADIQTPGGIVIELQHSPISVDEIQERERFYGRMIWIFDVREARGTERLDLRPMYGNPNQRTFRWKHAKKHIAYATKPTFLDLGNGSMFYLKKMYPQAPVGGWGIVGSVKSLVQSMNQQSWIFKTGVPHAGN